MAESDTAKTTSNLGRAGGSHAVGSEPDSGEADSRPPTDVDRKAASSRPPRDALSREQERRYHEALELQSAGDKEGALRAFEHLLAEHPGHAHGRLALFQLAVDLRDQRRAAEHHDWIVSYFLQTTNSDGLCQAYRETRIAFPELAWSEKSLIQVMHAGEKVHDARVAVDAAKLLIHTYPDSPTVPRAMLLGARVQEQEGRPDLARATLENIVNRYPRDPVAQVAKRRLALLS